MNYTSIQRRITFCEPALPRPIKSGGQRLAETSRSLAKVERFLQAKEIRGAVRPFWDEIEQQAGSFSPKTFLPLRFAGKVWRRNGSMNSGLWLRLKRALKYFKKPVAQKNAIAYIPASVSPEPVTDSITCRTDNCFPTWDRNDGSALQVADLVGN